MESRRIKGRKLHFQKKFRAGLKRLLPLLLSANIVLTPVLLPLCSYAGQGSGMEFAAAGMEAEEAAVNNRAGAFEGGKTGEAADSDEGVTGEEEGTEAPRSAEASDVGENEDGNLYIEDVGGDALEPEDSDGVSEGAAVEGGAAKANGSGTERSGLKTASPSRPERLPRGTEQIRIRCRAVEAEKKLLKVPYGTAEEALPFPEFLLGDIVGVSENSRVEIRVLHWQAEKKYEPEEPGDCRYRPESMEIEDPELENAEITYLDLPEFTVRVLESAISGTEAEPFVISTREDLLLFARQVNEEIINSKDFYAVLAEDIDLKGAAFTPIGSVKTAFRGHFDGGGHKILNLKIEDAVYGGFFAHVGEGASIENLGIESGSVTGEEYAAGIAAYAKGREILIDTCYNKASVRGDEKKSRATGGICGYGSKVSIKNVWNEGDIEGKSRVGGIAGELLGDYSGALVESALNKGAVSGQDRVGGVTGRCDSYAVLSESRNEGAVSGNLEKVGGITGEAGKEVKKCRNEGAVTAPKADEVGGIAGRSESRISEACNTASVEGGKQVGGVAGYGKKELLKSCNTGSVKAYEGSAGGIVGLLDASRWSESTIGCCYNIGKIEGDEDSGLVGTLDKSTRATIEYSYALGKFTKDTLLKEGDKARFTNVYYLGEESTEDGQRPKDCFESGELSFLLNEGKEKIWITDSITTELDNAPEKAPVFAAEEQTPENLYSIKLKNTESKEARLGELKAPFAVKAGERVQLEKKIYAPKENMEYLAEYKDKGGLDIGEDDSFVMPEKNVEISYRIIPKLAAGTVLKVTYKFEDGATADRVESYTVPDHKVKKPEEPKREGYTFLGWFKDNKVQRSGYREAVSHEGGLKQSIRRKGAS